MKMKKLVSLFLILALAAMCVGCGSSSAQASSAAAPTAEPEKAPESTSAPEQEPVSTSQSEPEEAATEPDGKSTSLVVYFSATGTTKGVAERIAAVTSGNLYEILAADPYTGDDLNYNDNSSRSTTEQNDKNARPEIGSEDISLEGYTTIYLGFPIWWGEEPRILDTFVEKYSFDGITVIPFCTSGGSGIGRSGPNMEALAGSGTWLEGKRFSGNVSEADLQAWIDGLK
jgi:flavodoxin